ncbi:MAG: amino acid ABC transporter permease [Acidimicrobiia bacterium]|nr:amino acid ABC transporter permease [Acidimicrobiia bacterium]
MTMSGRSDPERGIDVEAQMTAAIGVGGDGPIGPPDRRRRAPAWAETFPFWAFLLAAAMGWMGYLVFFNERYELAWDRIYPGLGLTVRITLAGFAIALALGVVVGLGRVSTSIVLRNISRTYVELIRGIPMLILIFTLALVLVPQAAGWLGYEGNRLSYFWRGSLALAIVYGAYIAEVVRGGVQSIGLGQMEAGRSLGLSRGQTMRSIVLPQAGRAMMPPLGNDLISMLKDSSLLSVLGVLEITQLGRQHAAGSFQFRESYMVLVLMYLTMTVLLSFVLHALERRVSRDRAGERA